MEEDMEKEHSITKMGIPTQDGGNTDKNAAKAPTPIKKPEWEYPYTQ